jgi:hypothetical protein
MKVTDYIHFELVSDNGRTKIFNVMDNKLIIESGVTSHYSFLGQIKWSGRWRQYIFVPDGETDWSRGCLQQIIDFINKLMEERKK